MINFPSPIPIASYSHFGCTWGLRAAVTAVEARLRARVYASLILFKCVCGGGCTPCFSTKSLGSSPVQVAWLDNGVVIEFPGVAIKKKAMRD